MGDLLQSHLVRSQAMILISLMRKIILHLRGLVHLGLQDPLGLGLFSGSNLLLRGLVLLGLQDHLDLAHWLQPGLESQRINVINRWWIGLGII